MEEEYMLDTPVVRGFIDAVRAALDASPLEQALDALRPAFAALLADPIWLPRDYQAPAENSGMGGGIATWLIYRAADGGLSLFSLVVPPGSATPIHDHLAWGLVGLYAGEQDEEVYRVDPAGGPLLVAERNQLRPGDFYALMPPEGDIHRVATTSAVPSVSIHLLGNDTGCTWRHTYTAEDGAAHAFRSGWSNVACRSAE